MSLDGKQLASKIVKWIEDATKEVLFSPESRRRSVAMYLRDLANMVEEGRVARFVELSWDGDTTVNGLMILNLGSQTQSTRIEGGER